MKYLFGAIAIFLFYTDAGAQKKSKAIFRSYNSVGIVAGKLPVAFTAQTENGLDYKNWFIGAGLGIDFYYQKTMPLFAAFKKAFPINSNSLFLYLNAGSNIITKNKKAINFFSIVETSGGFYTEAGVGYKINISKKSNVFFSLGTTKKNVRQTGFSEDVYGMPGVLDTHYKFSRTSFRMGYQF